MFKKAELFFWDCTIRCMQKPSTRAVIRKLGILNWPSLKISLAAITGGGLGLLAAYFVNCIH